jgi:hypothetical protein
VSRCRRSTRSPTSTARGVRRGWAWTGRGRTAHGGSAPPLARAHALCALASALAAADRPEEADAALALARETAPGLARLAVARLAVARLAVAGVAVAGVAVAGVAVAGVAVAGRRA